MNEKTNRPLAGQTAFVTGGASGIGRETVSVLATQGARVIVADRNIEGAQAVANCVVNAGGNAIAIEVDVADSASVDGALRAALAAYPVIDILIHSAGIGAEIDFLSMEEAEWRRIIDVDLTGTFLISQAVAREMAQRGYGRIVLLSSTAGERGGTGRGAYGAAKAGVIGLSRVMAVELAPRGITVNVLAPGAIETELVLKMHDHETRRAYTTAIPLNRYGEVRDVAITAAFLASPESNYITGVVVPVDGGFMAAGVMKRST